MLCCSKSTNILNEHRWLVADITRKLKRLASQNCRKFEKGTSCGLIVTRERSNDRVLDIDIDINEKLKMAAGQKGIMC